MLSNLLLTAGEHEFIETWDRSQYPEVPGGGRGDGWAMIAIVPYTAEGKPGYLWARRKDGRPMIHSLTGNDVFQQQIAELTARLNEALDSRQELVLLARKMLHGAPSARHDLSEWIARYDETEPDR